MKSKHAIYCGLALIVGVLIYTLVVYPALPAQIPIHWNWRGEVDGWADKRYAVWFMPGTMICLLALLPAFPMISPRKFDMESFLPTYNDTMLMVIALLGYMDVIMLRAALDPELPFFKALMIGIFLLFALMGNVLGKTRRNFFMGIRTPWTLASEEVWIGTHRMAARIFVMTGILGIVAICLGVPPIVTLILIVPMTLVPLIYSYVLYQQIEGKK